MPIAWTTIKPALRTWIKNATGLADDKVIWANDNGPRPKVPFATINPRLSVVRVGAFDRETDTDTPGVIQRVGQRRITVSVNIYGPGAIALCEAAQDALETAAIAEVLSGADLAVADHGTVRNLTKFLETAAEERGQFDVQLNAADVSTEDVGWVEQMLASGTVDTVSAVELDFTVGP